MSSPIYYLAALAFLTIFYLWRRPRGKLPPGPRGIPLLGNLFQLPKLQWLQFTEWKQKYGMFYKVGFYLLYG